MYGIEKLRMKFPEARIAQRRHDDMIRNSGGVHIAERLGSPGQPRSLHPPFRGSQSQVPISYFQTNLVQVATFSINGSSDSRNSIGEISERVSALILDGFAQLAFQLVEFTHILGELVVDGIGELQDVCTLIDFQRVFDRGIRSPGQFFMTFFVCSIRRGASAINRERFL